MNATERKSAIARLREQKASTAPTEEGIGLEHGAYWALTHARYDSLRKLALWWRKCEFPPAGTPLTLCHEVAAIVTINHGRRDQLEAANDLFFHKGYTAPDDVPNDYVADWVEGALSVFQEVENNC